MGHAGDSLALLTTDSEAEAEALATKLEALNLTSNRPAIALAAWEEGKLTARARSVPEVNEVNMVETLAQCEDLFERYGGHAQAAGFTLRSCNLTLLVERMTTLAEAALGEADLKVVLPVDAEVQLPDLNGDVLADQEPWGLKTRPPPS